MLTKFDKEYWEARALKYGHTGNGNPFLYCFDQQARLFAISQIIEKLNLQKKHCALDFGCGSGDFIELLKTKFNTVYGYDLSETMIRQVKQRFRADKNISASHDLTDIKKSKSYDLIITVTVLQTLAKDELAETVRMLSESLDDHGYMIVLEFFPTEKYVRKANEDKATVTEWEEIRISNRLKLDATYSFYNGFLNTARSWQRYKKNIWINFLRVFQRRTFAQKVFTSVSKRLIHQYKDVLVPENGSFNIHVLTKHL